MSELVPQEYQKLLKLISNNKGDNRKMLEYLQNNINLNDRHKYFEFKHLLVVPADEGNYENLLSFIKILNSQKFKGECFLISHENI